MGVDANWYSCHVGVISRSHTRTAVGAAAYITGTKLYDRELEASPNYEPSDYTRKGGIEQWFITAPEKAPEWSYNLQTLVNEMQAKDTRKNSCTARVAIIALPDSADAEGRSEIAHTIADYISERYQVPVLAGIHAPDRHGDNRNWHMHLEFATRQIDENGLGAKTRVLDAKQTGSEEITHIREAVAGIINDYLEEAGIDERVDHRSYEDRGIERKATIHMGAAASGLERKGISTERGDINREIVESNRKIDQLISEIAQMQAEIVREQERELSEPEPKVEEPQRGPEAVIRWEQTETERQSAFTSEITRAYMEQAAPTQQEERERSERRWYEELYNSTIETVQRYWGRFVGRIASKREERERNDFDGPER